MSRLHDNELYRRSNRNPFLPINDIARLHSAKVGDATSFGQDFTFEPLHTTDEFATTNALNKTQDNSSHWSVWGDCELDISDVQSMVSLLTRPRRVNMTVPTSAVGITTDTEFYNEN